MLTPNQVHEVILETTSNTRLIAVVTEVIDSVDLTFDTRERVFNFVHAINKVRKDSYLRGVNDA